MQGKKRRVGYYIKRDWILYAMLILPMAYYIVFKYAPMYGVTVAFKNYNIFQGVMGSEWGGTEIFQNHFCDGRVLPGISKYIDAQYLRSFIQLSGAHHPGHHAVGNEGRSL